MLKRNLFKTRSDEDLDRQVVQIKFIQDRVKMVEKHIPELRKTLFDYTDKTAKSRDSLDKIALALNDYSKAEKVTLAFKNQIDYFANVLLDVGTKRDAQARALEGKVLEQLRDYEKLCTNMHNELKLSIAACEKERSWMRHVTRVRVARPQDQEQISFVEAEYMKAIAECARVSKNLEEQIDFFEKKKLTDLKEALLAWTLTELHFHSKALQLFTDAYNIAADIDVNQDVEEFRSKLRSKGEGSGSSALSRSQSVVQMPTASYRRRMRFTGSGIPRPSSSRSSPPSPQPSTSSQEP